MIKMKDNKHEEHWIEVSLLVNQELVEAVASALSEIIPGGVVLERIIDGVFPHELDLEVGPVRVYGYLPVDNNLEERRDKVMRALFYLGRISPIPDPVFSTLKGKDWATAWQKHYRPIPLGPRLIVVPSWLENPAPERIPIFMDPGMAFGSGTHPSTQLALILLEKCLAENPSSEMIDIGCGSGILSIAAVKLGVFSVLGVDTDPDAVRIARTNAEINRVDDQTNFAQGSVPELLRNDFQLSQASLITVNIIVPILEKLFEEGLRETITPGGNIVFSGILEDQLASMLDLLTDQGIKLRNQCQQGEWIALWGSREGK